MLFMPDGRRDVPDGRAHDRARRRPHRAACAARAGPTTSTASPPSSPSCSRSSARAARTSGARTRSSSRSSAAWPPISTSRSRSSAARSCASPTASRCRAATSYLVADDRRRATVLVRALRAGGRRGGRRRARRRRASAQLIVGHRRHRARWCASTTPRSSTPPRCEPVDALDGDTLVALAAFVGTTRLIDNVTISFDGDTRPDADRRRAHRIVGMQEDHDAPDHDEVEDPPGHVTGADLDYVGSITLDPRLMELADLREYEQVHVLDIDNGARFETYVIRGGPGDVILNGAAARLVHTGRQGDRHHLRALRRSRARGVRAARRPRRRDNRPTVQSVPDVRDAAP